MIESTFSLLISLVNGFSSFSFALISYWVCSSSLLLVTPCSRSVSVGLMRCRRKKVRLKTRHSISMETMSSGR